MLPGFRFLFAAIVLSMSILIFGLGAAALLRSAHEEFASLPSRRAPAGPVFARQSEPQIPTLDLLRFDPPAADNKPQDGSAAPVSETVAPVEQAQEAMPAEPEKLAALKPDEPMPVEATTPIAPAEAAPPSATEEIRVATTSEASEASAPPAAVNESTSLEGNIAATKIATLGGPAVIIQEKTVSNTTDARPDRSVVRKRSAQRARERRRLAARRARLAARQAAIAAGQQQTTPFGQTSTSRAP